MNKDIGNMNLFMMCKSLERGALSELPAGYCIRSLRCEELNLWKAIHFDDPDTVVRYRGFMDQYFQNVYAHNETLFFDRCKVVCDEADRPIGTCFVWKSYDRFNAVHWFKVIKPHEGKGVGRALLSYVMRDLTPEEYPVYLHTQPTSDRAIKLYTDFGFSLLTDPIVGLRDNDLKQSLMALKIRMPAKAYENLRFESAPSIFLDACASSPINAF